jgi:hypothetical protein
VLNNPLRYIDPLGLYEWDTSLGGSATDDELKKRKGGQKIIERRNAIRRALSDAAKAATDKNLTADQRAEILRAVNAYGTEGQQNGVTLAFGKVENGVAETGCTTEYCFTGDTNGNLVPAIKITFEKAPDAEDVAHEGSHAADRMELKPALERAPSTSDYINSPENITKYATVRRAYAVSSYVAQAMGREERNANGTEYWNKGWSAAERETKRRIAVDAAVKSSNNVTPEKPGRRLLELKNETN